MNDVADLLGHVWLEGRCKRCEIYLREAPADVRCHPRDWVDHIEECMNTGKRVKTRASRAVPSAAGSRRQTR